MLNFKSESEFKAYCDEHPELCLAIYKKEIFDVTKFLNSHPGGPDIIQDCNGCDITEIFHSEYPHSHSDNATKMIFNYKVGHIHDKDTNEVNSDDNTTSSPSSIKEKKSIMPYPTITETTIEYKDGFKIDRTKGLIWQVPKMNKKNYLEMIHNPVVLSECKLLDNYYLENYAAKTRPKTIVIIWIPISTFFLYLGLTQNYDTESSIFDPYVNIYNDNFSLPLVLLCYIFGIMVWSKGEYMLHRWIFHSDKYCPDNGWALCLHFLLHGIHHMIPMDKDRLVFPPALGFAVFYFVKCLILCIFHGAFGRIIIAGFLIGYVFYDCFHYSSHHLTTEIGYFNDMKKYHNKHHYVSGDYGYGITSKFWDIIYGTQFKDGK